MMFGTIWGNGLILNYGENMFKELVIPYGIMLLLLFSLQSCVAAAKSDPVSINGTIRIVGSEKLSHVVLRTGDAGDKDVRDYLITGPLVQELRSNFQGKVVTLEGTVCSSQSPEFTRCFKPANVIVD